MSHSLTKIWIHTVFRTKNGEPLIVSSLEEELYIHIHRHLTEDFNCWVRIIKGMKDHLHILFLLNPNYSLKDILKNIKGESSHWVNQKDILKIKFAWQVGYGAFSVSESNVDAVEKYIENQKEHHKMKTFLEEYEEIIDKHGLTYLPRDMADITDSED